LQEQQSYQEALELLTKAADEGCAKSWKHLAYLYQYGLTNEPDIEKAVDCYVKAIPLGDGVSSRDLADALMEMFIDTKSLRIPVEDWITIAEKLARRRFFENVNF